jgi:glycosyltransferase involved in cell wall biosynthesis
MNQGHGHPSPHFRLSGPMHPCARPVGGSVALRTLAPATATASVAAGPRESHEAWLRGRTSGPMARGSILVHAGSSAFQEPGGGEVQLIETARHLEGLGHAVRPFVPWIDRIEQSRLLHLFGMSREGLELARVARSRGVAVVVSPICWLEPRAFGPLAGSRLGGIGARLKWLARGVAPRGLGWRGSLLRLADLVLPNSEAEADQLVSRFGADRDRVEVVPNGVDRRFDGADPAVARERFGAEPFALFVGRIEPRKNVMGAIQAARRAGRRLVVIGGVVPGHEDYARRCGKAGGSAVTWVGAVAATDPLLASSYAAARVLVLPSWFETPGLAALEAALAGCAVVITPYGSTREVFGDRVRYARPDRVGEIAEAISDAWSVGPDASLRDHVRSLYLWDRVARRTAEAYARVAT